MILCYKFLCIQEHSGEKLFQRTLPCCWLLFALIDQLLIDVCPFLLLTALQVLKEYWVSQNDKLIFTEPLKQEGSGCLFNEDLN